MAESRRLWEIETGNTQLTTIHAAQVLSLRLLGDGADKIGLSYLVHAAAMGEQMELFTRKEEGNTKMSIARAFTAWSLFSWSRPVCHWIYDIRG